MTPGTNDRIVVRQLKADDLDAMRQLLDVFGEAFNEVDIYGGSPPEDRYLERLLSGDYLIVVAALAEGRVVGGLAAYELPKFEQQRSEIFVYDLAVAETFRRRGIATALLEETRKIAVERGAYEVFIQADKGDDPAISLYGKFGKREDMSHFAIDPADP